ncbi:hypothetical protein TBR22_A06270 [Luteitalea sp. TBR-22]|nr:hypothetical protein TBR22_A06270 [Luteitalea sp. TBR-22]
MTAQAPHTYADWADRLERFSAGDDSMLECMQAGTLEWSSVVAERWTRLVDNALATRLQALSQRLQRALDQANGDAFGVSRALLDARRTLSTLHGLTTLACLDGQVKTHLANQLSRWATRTHESLQGASSDPRNAALRKILRDQPLTAAATAVPYPGPFPAATDTPAGVRPRRQIL